MGGGNVNSVGAHPVCQVLDNFHVGGYLFTEVKGVCRTSMSCSSTSTMGGWLAFSNAACRTFCNHAFEVTVAGLEHAVGDIGPN